MQGDRFPQVPDGIVEGFALRDDGNHPAFGYIAASLAGAYCGFDSVLHKYILFQGGRPYGGISQGTILGVLEKPVQPGSRACMGRVFERVNQE